MARYVLKNLISVLIFLSLSPVFCKQDLQLREISLEHNPGCDINDCKAIENTSVHLFYARAKGTQDSLHYILSTVGPSPPTLLLLKSDASSIVRVNWTEFLTGADHAGAVKLVSEQGRQEVKAGIENVLIFDKLHEYNDTKDSVNINDSIVFSPILLRHLLWNITSLNLTHSQLTGTSKEDPQAFHENSSIHLDFTIFGKRGQESELPALPHNANSSDWMLSLDNLVARGNGSRFSLELLMLTKDSKITKSREKSINDEYCPAVFTMEKIEWKHEMSAERERTESFAQWRAVSYTTNPAVRKFSTDVKTSDTRAVNRSSSQYTEDIQNNRLLVAYFGTKRLKNLDAASVIVSFGRPEDGFYSSSKFLSWTASVGFYSPPYDAFSTLIICVLVAGVACPSLVILFGGLYMFYRWLSRKSSESSTKVSQTYDYQPI